MAHLGWNKYMTNRHNESVGGRKRAQKGKQRQAYCWACNTPLRSGTLCPACKKDIRLKQLKEGTGKK